MPGYVYRGTQKEAPGEIRPAHWGKSGPKPATKPFRPSPLKPFDPAKCGTMPGWRQHRAHGQKECRLCMDAQNDYMKKYRKKGRGG